MIQYSDQLLDSFAPELSSLAHGDIKSLGGELARIKETMLHFGYQDVLGARLRKVPARTYRHFQRRTISAVRSYEGMRLALDEFFVGRVRDSPKFSNYFHALDEAETCILHCQIALESIKNSSSHFDDIDKDETNVKVGILANDIKHFGQKTKGRAGANSLFPVWFSSGGVKSDRDFLSFFDLHQTLVAMIEGCDALADNSPLRPNAPQSTA